MENFCSFCGKELVDGKCECDDFTEAHVELKMKKFGVRMKCFMKKVLATIVKTIKNPIDEIAKEKKGAKVSWVIGFLAVFVVFVTNFISPIFLVFFKSIQLKAEVAFWMAMIPFLMIFVMSCITFLFRKTNRNKQALKDIISTFCIAMVLPAVFYTISYVLSFLWIPGAIIFLILVGVSWILLCMEATVYVLEGDRNLVYWLMLILVMVMFIIVGVCGVEIIIGVTTEVMEVFEEYLASTVETFKLFVVDTIKNILFGEG